MTINRKPRYIFVAAAFAAAAFSTQAIAAGQADFQAKCAGCHGADASGNTALGKNLKLRDLRSPGVQKQSDADIQGVITNGKPPMPAFGKSMDAAKVQELVAYLRSVATK